MLASYVRERDRRRGRVAARAGRRRPGRRAACAVVPLPDLGEGLVGRVRRDASAHQPRMLASVVLGIVAALASGTRAHGDQLRLRDRPLLGPDRDEGRRPRRDARRRRRGTVGLRRPAASDAAPPRHRRPRHRRHRALRHRDDLRLPQRGVGDRRALPAWARSRSPGWRSASASSRNRAWGSPPRSAASRWWLWAEGARMRRRTCAAPRDARPSRPRSPRRWRRSRSRPCGRWR